MRFFFSPVVCLRAFADVGAQAVRVCWAACCWVRRSAETAAETAAETTAATTEGTTVAEATATGRGPVLERRLQREVHPLVFSLLAVRGQWPLVEC